MRQLLLLFACIGLYNATVHAQLTLITSFDPAEAGGLCGIGYDPDSSHVWVYGCSESQIHCYTTDGTYVKSFNMAGEAANDVDFDFSSENFTMDDSSIGAFDILFINGETDNAEVYAIDRSSGDVIDTLHTQFGVSHIVGGSWHHIRNTFFLVQDNVPGPDQQNTVAEINPVTGEVLQSFQISDNFSVNYGDLEVCTVSGNLFIVSSQEGSIAEYTPDGEFLQELTLPSGVFSLSGIAMDYTAGTAWVSSNNGTVFLIGGINCNCTPSSSTMSASACESYTSPSGLYTWTTSGVYEDVLINETGCDSVITITLDIANLSPTVTLEDGVLSCSDEGDVTYQWVDCDGKLSPVPNAINQTFIPEEEGNYAVTVMNGECTATSECVFFSPSYVAENRFVSFLNVYPNPTQNDFIISYQLKQNSTVEILLWNALGEKTSATSTIKNMPAGLQQETMELDRFPAGVYLLEVKFGDYTVTRRIVKE